MTPNEPPQLDPVSVVISTMSIFFSARMSAVLGPYLVILVSATLGAYIALGMRPKIDRAPGFRFFLIAVLSAFLFTVMVTKAVKANLGWLDDVDENLIFGPVACLIGVFSDRWKDGAFIFFSWLRRTFGAAKSANDGEKP